MTLLKQIDSSFSQGEAPWHETNMDMVMQEQYKKNQNYEISHFLISLLSTSIMGFFQNLLFYINDFQPACRKNFKTCNT